MNKKFILLLIFIISLTIYTKASDTKASEKPLSLDDCINCALENNSAVDVAEKQVEVSHAKVDEILAERYPTIYAIGSASQYHYQSGYQNFTLSKPLPFGTDINQIALDSDNFDAVLAVEMNQIIYDGGAVNIKLITARLEEENEKIKLQSVKENLSYKVKLAFYSALKAKDQLLLSEENIRASKDHLKLTEALFESGFVPQVDKVSAEIALTKAEMLSSQAQNEYDKSLNNLNSAMGRGMEEAIEIYSDNSFTPVNTDEKILLKKAITGRFEIRQLNLALSQQKDSISAIEALIKPTINVITGYAVRNDNSMGRKGFYIELGLSMPIFNVRDRAEMDKVNASTEQVKKQKELVETNIELEVKNALLDLKSAESCIEIAEKEVDLSLLQLQISEGKYKQGAGAIMEVTASQLNLTKSKTDYINAIYNYKIALATVEHVANIKIEDVQQKTDK